MDYSLRVGHSYIKAVVFKVAIGVFFDREFAGDAWRKNHHLMAALF